MFYFFSLCQSMLSFISKASRSMFLHLSNFKMYEFNLPAEGLVQENLNVTRARYDPDTGTKKGPLSDHISATLIGKPSLRWHHCPRLGQEWPRRGPWPLWRTWTPRLLRRYAPEMASWSFPEPWVWGTPLPIPKWPRADKQVVMQQGGSYNSNNPKCSCEPNFKNRVSWLVSCGATPLMDTRWPQLSLLPCPGVSAHIKP